MLSGKKWPPNRHKNLFEAVSFQWNTKYWSNRTLICAASKMACACCFAIAPFQVSIDSCLVTKMMAGYPQTFSLKTSLMFRRVHNRVLLMTKEKPPFYFNFYAVLLCLYFRSVLFFSVYQGIVAQNTLIAGWLHIFSYYVRLKTALSEITF